MTQVCVAFVTMLRWAFLMTTQIWVVVGILLHFNCQHNNVVADDSNLSYLLLIMQVFVELIVLCDVKKIIQFYEKFPSLLSGKQLSLYVIQFYLSTVVLDMYNYTKLDYFRTLSKLVELLNYKSLMKENYQRSDLQFCAVQWFSFYRYETKNH